MNQTYQSWGRYPRIRQQAMPLKWRDESLPDLEGKSMLPFGNGRSYGDCCLNAEGLLLDTRGLDRFIDFDPSTGRLRCEAGVLLADILDLTVPLGWFLSVTPGTKYVTLGGAIANDVHGKNHHREGSFGCHVRCFELLRSDGRRLMCSPRKNIKWFKATIGGLGLTGLITWAEISMKRITSPYIEAETIRYDNLDEFFDLTRESDQHFEYTVAWVDGLARGRSLGRGLFMRGNHATKAKSQQVKAPRRYLSFPIDMPFSLVGRSSVKAFNLFYYHRPQKAGLKLVHYDPFFYPLDAIDHWNRMYGARGFFQYQCVVPFGKEDVIEKVLSLAAECGCPSFLAILKKFGDKPSTGLMSFPRPGITLALDFPNEGEGTLALLEEFDHLVRNAGGAVYPAKDARMSSESFRSYFPKWERFLDFVDPHFSSSFWRRVAGDDT